MIHPTAIVDGKAELGEDVSVGPYSVIEGDVKIGAGTVIGSHATIARFTRIGENCKIHSHAALGGPPQSLRFAGEETWVTIGSNCVLREFVTVHRGTGFGGGLTSIGDENFIMAYSHVAHDCKTGRGVVFANNATLAGHVTVGDYATIGGLSAVHQFSRIGEHAFVGGMSGVAKDIPPYVLASGERVRLYGINKVGLVRKGFSPETVDALKKAYRIVFRLGLTMNEALSRVKASVEPFPQVLCFIEFLETSSRGVARAGGRRE